LKVGRVPIVVQDVVIIGSAARVYRACLAEVARRAAHAALHAGQAQQLAERMARGREREVSRRDAFARSHER